MRSLRHTRSNTHQAGCKKFIAVLDRLDQSDVRECLDRDAKVRGDQARPAFARQEREAGRNP